MHNNNNNNKIQPKSFDSVSVYGNCGETTQAHYTTKLYSWLMHDIIIIIAFRSPWEITSRDIIK